MEVVRFTDGATRHEIWKLPDGGWEDWAIVVDRFLMHAIGVIAAEGHASLVGWLEINYWPISGRLIVFPSRDGPHGDRCEPVCFELLSAHLEAESRQISESVPDEGQEAAWTALADQVWMRVAECLTGGAGSKALAEARRSNQLKVAAYDNNPGEGPFRLSQDGAWIT